MRFTHRREAVSAECDMTPMIDMTFQLIAFFMVLINFAEADQNQRIHLPTSQLAKPPEAPFEIPVTLHLTKDGTVIYAGEEVPLQQVEPLLRREKSFIERGLYGKHKPRDATVIIRADAEAKAGQVQELIALCQGLEFEKFALRAQQEEIQGGT
ncbi:MAG: biopolymer transporter ExbD [Pirellulales bacterium]|nr:biopolymer transporter ExbD [Pirellulales bacterium]